MLKQFLINILLTFVWVALTGDFELGNYTFGFLLSYFILRSTAVKDGGVSYFNRIPKIIGFLFFFLYEMLKANLQVAYDVITPRFFMKPGIVKFPLSAKTDLEITLLANCISLTPGTLIIAVSDDRKAIFVHVMYLEDRDKFIEEVKNGLEKRLLEVLR
ncbi:Na+/H+ antiporter subunit E [Albibacterium sp.]|uniref:Na+/H+ antiporter subunit E n=1 Tax=Albibacterium sp. TaxID=2952885 RepID=UPI002BDF7F3D|nr:Na+/H+ antiporter subunit E [Albibacterium sp.]HUH17792.1 Na+/H+ antiporter subunit E [Albibacterium sp.]